MKVNVRKIDLIEALDRVKPSVATNKMIQILTTFAFKGNHLFGYNGTSGTMTNNPLDGMSFCVEKELFYKIIAKMFDEIIIEQKEGKIVIKSGSNKTELQTINPLQYPDFLPKNTESFCQAPNLVNCLERVSFTMGTNPMKPQLLGACISNGYAYSSDGQRISRAKLNLPASGSLTIPAASVDHICKLGIADEITVERNSSGMPTRASFYYTMKNTVYTTTVLAQDFPSATVDKMFSSPLNEKYTSQFPDELGEVIDRVSLLTTDETGLIFSNDPGKGLHVQAMTKEIGEADEIIPWNFPYEFRFAARADRVKKAFERTQKVDLSDVIEGKKQTVRFSDDSFDHLLALIMLQD